MVAHSTTSALAIAAAAALLGGAAPGEAVLGPTGYKTLFLGQPANDAEATGLLTGQQASPQCDYWSLRPEEGQGNPGSGVFIDPELGVVVIGGTDLSHTPEGITLGSTRADVEAAYDELTPVPPFDWVVTVDVPDEDSGAKYRIAFDEEDRVSDFGLEAADTGGCVE